VLVLFRLHAALRCMPAAPLLSSSWRSLERRGAAHAGIAASCPPLPSPQAAAERVRFFSSCWDRRTFALHWNAAFFSEMAVEREREVASAVIRWMA
jgi:hypothetical protein